MRRRGSLFLMGRRAIDFSGLQSFCKAPGAPAVIILRGQPYWIMLSAARKFFVVVVVSGVRREALGPAVGVGSCADHDYHNPKVLVMVD